MKQKMDYRKELDRAREAVKDLARDGDAETLDAYWEVCCGDVLVAEENLKDQDRVWENASLARELLDIGTYLEGYDSMLDNLYLAVSRMVTTLFDHPRLKLELLELELQLLRRIEAMNGHDLDMSEDVQEKIYLYRHNIECADQGNFDDIEQEGHLKQDPIEWSAEYERVIDEADKKVYSLLKDHPRGMGFCFAYWHAKAQVLSEDYGITWRSPSLMNPHVMFD